MSLLRKRAGRWGSVVLAAPMAVFGLAATATMGASSASASVTNAASGGVYYELYQSCPDNPFWAAVNNGGNAAAKQLGITLKIEDPLRCTGEIAQENDLLTTIVNSHPAGIAFSVVSSTAFSSNIQRARSLHIPIIAYNSLPHGVNLTVNPVEAYVGQHNEVAGEDLAKEVVPMFHLHSGQTIVVADQCYTNETCNNRYQGVEQVVDPLGIKVTVINLDYNVPQSASIMKAYFEAHGEPALVVALGSAGEQAVVQGATALGLTPKKVPMVGFDDDAVTNTYMEDGWVKVTVDQQPFLQGYDALVDLYDAVHYKAYPINMDTGPVFLTYTPNNVAKGWFNPTVVS
ncbi:MAG: substrate-binding domain-containing protein, partial [Acidimicrobiales bacterium]